MVFESPNLEVSHAELRQRYEKCREEKEREPGNEVVSIKAINLVPRVHRLFGQRDVAGSPSDFPLTKETVESGYEICKAKHNKNDVILRHTREGSRGLKSCTHTLVD